MDLLKVIAQTIAVILGFTAMLCVLAVLIGERLIDEDKLMKRACVIQGQFVNEYNDGRDWQCVRIPLR